MTVVTGLLICGLIWYALIRALEMVEPTPLNVPGKRIDRKCGSEG